MFYLIGIVLTFFLAFLLITKRGKTAADRILVIWLVVIGLHLLLFYLTITEKIFSLPYLLGVISPFPLLHGPFLFLYTRAVTNQRMGYKYRLLHFLPFILTYCLFLPFFFLPPDQRILIYQNEGRGYEIQVMILLLLIVASGIVYVSLSLWLLKKHKKIIRDQFSSADKINLAWLRYLIYGIGVIWLFVLFDSDTMIFNSVVVFVFFLGYFGIKQVGIFTQDRPSDKEATDVNELVTRTLPPPDTDSIDKMVDDTGKGKYLRSSLSKRVANEIHASLTKAMEADRLFTNPELTLSKLAETLNVHPHNLSQVINTFEGKSFYDYINHQRIIEFKRIAGLPESRKYTLLSLAHDCGFNSKTSFNRNFKDATGLTPSEYLSQTHIQLEV